MSRFSQVIVVCNPASTHAHHVHKRIKLLQTLTPKEDFLVVSTKEGGASVNKELMSDLSSLLGERTLLCIAAGDGTANLIVQALLTNSTLSEDARRTVILPIWGGNANDLACMLNGTPWRNNVAHIADNAPVVAIRPLRCTLTMPDGTERTHLAACYASFGASAFAAQRLASPRMRFHPLDRIPGGRAIKEWTTVIRALFDAPLISITEDERPVPMYEHIFLNGSRFAKVKGTSLKLTDPYFFTRLSHTSVPGQWHTT